MQIVESAATGTLKNTTYLERNDGKKLFLEEYVPPGKDGSERASSFRVWFMSDRS